MKQIMDMFKKKKNVDPKDSKVQAANPFNLSTGVTKIRQIKDARKKQLDDIK